MAYGINDRGCVAGFFKNGDRAFTWCRGGTQQPLPLPLGHTISRAWDINALGQVVGVISNWRPILWNSDGSMVDLGFLPGGNYGVALAVNKHSQVAGTADNNRCFFWDPIDRMIEITSGDPNVNLSVAYGINNKGEVVGQAGEIEPNITSATAFIWDRDAGFRNLKDLIDPESGWSLTRAYDINEAGEIVGFGDDPFGNKHGFLLIPTVSRPWAVALTTGLVQIGPGETGLLDGSPSLGSAITSYAWDLDTDGEYDDAIGYEVQVTYEYLVETLGLGVGPHTVSLLVTTSDGASDWTTERIVIVPEPATFALLALCGLVVARRKRR